MWRAFYESANFTFEAFGDTEEEARAFLLDGFTVHAKQYDCEPDWFFPEDIRTGEIHARSVFRDYQQLGGSK